MAILFSFAIALYLYTRAAIAVKRERDVLAAIKRADEHQREYERLVDIAVAASEKKRVPSTCEDENFTCSNCQRDLEEHDWRPFCSLQCQAVYFDDEDDELCNHPTDRRAP